MSGRQGFARRCLQALRSRGAWAARAAAACLRGQPQGGAGGPAPRPRRPARPPGPQTAAAARARSWCPRPPRPARCPPRRRLAPARPPTACPAGPGVGRWQVCCAREGHLPGAARRPPCHSGGLKTLGRPVAGRQQPALPQARRRAASGRARLISTHFIEKWQNGRNAGRGMPVAHARHELPGHPACPFAHSARAGRRA